MSDERDGPDPLEPPSVASAEGIASREALATPSTLFHYTSTAGLLGIVESGAVWATDLAYLNDRQEMMYGLW